MANIMSNRALTAMGLRGNLIANNPNAVPDMTRELLAACVVYLAQECEAWRINYPHNEPQATKSQRAKFRNESQTIEEVLDALAS